MVDVAGRIRCVCRFVAISILVYLQALNPPARSRGPGRGADRCTTVCMPVVKIRPLGPSAGWLVVAAEDVTPFLGVSVLRGKNVA